MLGSYEIPSSQGISLPSHIFPKFYLYPLWLAEGGEREKCCFNLKNRNLITKVKMKERNNSVEYFDGFKDEAAMKCEKFWY